MHVIRARSAGFCFGVSLALQRLDKEVERLQKGLSSPPPAGRLLTLGPIIHNPRLMRQYAELGVDNEEDIFAVRSGDRVVIRAHGIPEQDEASLVAAGAKVIDATCPKVKKAQTAIAEASANGAILLLFGERDHPEVRGLLSYARHGAHVFGSRDEAAEIALDPEKSYFLAAQTTQDRAAFLTLKDDFLARIPAGLPVLDTICDATRRRQEEVLALARQTDLIVVVGGLNSGNTRRLAEVAEAAGIPAVHVEHAEDLPERLPPERRASIGAVGLTAGASTPQEHIDAAEALLRSL